MLKPCDKNTLAGSDVFRNTPAPLTVLSTKMSPQGTTLGTTQGGLLGVSLKRMLKPRSGSVKPGRTGEVGVRAKRSMMEAEVRELPWITLLVWVMVTVLIGAALVTSE